MDKHSRWIVRSANTAASMGGTKDALGRLADAIEVEYPEDISLVALLRELASNAPHRSRAMRDAVDRVTGGQCVRRS